MFQSFFVSRKHIREAYGLGFVLFCILVLDTYINLWITNGLQELGNIAARGYQISILGTMTAATKADIIQELIISFAGFTLLAAFGVVVGSCVAYCTSKYALSWRKSMTAHYTERWSRTQGHIELASQCIQQNIERFTVLLETIFVAVFKGGMTLIIFYADNNLSELDKKMMAVTGIDIPNMLIWLAMITGIGGTVISAFAGKRLTQIIGQKQITENNFRNALLYKENGARDEQSLAEWTPLFGEVCRNVNRTIGGYFWFNIWQNSYSRAMSALPIFLASLAVATGAIAFGDFTKITLAFAQMNGSFSVLIYSWPMVMEFSAMRRLLSQFGKELHAKEQEMKK